MPRSTVAGESTEVLLEALRRIEWETTADGMSQGSLRLEPRLAGPLLRAHARVQAELMRHDANRPEESGNEQRTQTQRAADALVALALRVADAFEENH